MSSSRLKKSQVQIKNDKEMTREAKPHSKRVKRKMKDYVYYLQPHLKVFGINASRLQTRRRLTLVCQPRGCIYPPTS